MVISSGVVPVKGTPHCVMWFVAGDVHLLCYTRLADPMRHSAARIALVLHCAPDLAAETVWVPPEEWLSFKAQI